MQSLSAGSVFQVAQTCQLALQRIQYHNQHDTPAEQDESRYLSVDPTPAAPSTTPANELRSTLLDEEARIFDRYRAMFALRNKGGRQAVTALGEAFASQSALLKHEVAYVLGQMQDAEGVSTLRYSSSAFMQSLHRSISCCHVTPWLIASHTSFCIAHVILHRTTVLW